MTEEQQPEQEPIAETQVPEASEVSEAERTELAAEASQRLEEPERALRLSPFAIAALVVSLFGLSQATQVVFASLGQLSIRTAMVAVVPLALSIVGLWLAARGDEEIFVSEGRFGGVGFCRAARVISVFTLVFVAVNLVLNLVTESPGGLSFDV